MYSYRGGVFISRNLLLIFFLALFFTSCNTNNIIIVQETTNEIVSDIPITNSNYIFNLDIDPLNRKISGTQKIKYVNNTGIALDKIFFNIPINNFNTESKSKPYLDSEKDFIYTKSFSENGYLNVFNIMVNQESLNFTQKDSVLEVDFISKLNPNESIDIILEMDGIIPNIKHRSGSSKDILWINNFLPTVAVFDKYGWHTDTNYHVGDPFFTNVANYDVTITTPSDYSVVSTGREVSTISENKNTTTVNTKLVRDFSFAIIKDFNIHTLVTKDDVTISFYTYSVLDAAKEENIKELLIATEASINKLNELLGTYPYHSLDFVETDTFFKKPIVSSTIVFLNSDVLFGSDSKFSITDSISRQWFYGIIGNNPIKEAWLNEGISLFFTDYITLNKNDLDLKLKQEYDTLQKDILLLENKILLEDLSVYDDTENYYAIQCIRAKLMIYSLFNKLGTEKFLEFAKLYHTNFAFLIVDKDSFIATAEQVYGENLTEFFNSWTNYFKLPPIL